jgi:hypothetical protein
VQAVINVLDYSQRIETVPMKSTSHHWPPACTGKICVWDCGNYWDGYDEPAHVGLDNATKNEFLALLGHWLHECSKMAESGRHCYKPASAVNKVAHAVEVAKQSEYWQEVYVDFLQGLFFFQEAAEALYIIACNDLNPLR